MRILFSISYAMNVGIAPGRYNGHDVTVVPRSSDWGLRGLRKYLYHGVEAIRLLIQARTYDALAVFTVGIEAFLIGKFHNLICPNTRIVCVDFLMPRTTGLLRLVQSGLQGIDGFVCIRTGDIGTLWERFHVPASRCEFAPFPSNREVMRIRTQEEGYVYSAGWAHRDWPTLVAALEGLPYRAILSSGGSVEVPEAARERIVVLSQRSPDEGRQLMARASLIVLPLKETDLPSGPLVMLDAMAMGKAVIVTNVNGSRDYGIDGRTALFVPPGDREALAAAIESLMSDEALRNRLGLDGREDVCRRFTTDRFINKAIELCTRHAGASCRAGYAWQSAVTAHEKNA